MSEVNREEAQRCRMMGLSAQAAGDTDKALRLLRKAQRMSPSDSSLAKIIAMIERDAAQQAQGSRDEGPRFRGGAAASAASRPDRAGTSSGGGASSSSGAASRPFTAEEAQLVKRIQRTKDYYAVLEVPRDASEDVIRRAYKKLSLRVHPDKNQAPGADEAFKKVSQAMQCLTDEEKRATYDRYGDEEPPRQQPRRRQHRHDDDFITAEDIFSFWLRGDTRGFNGRGHRRGDDDRDFTVAHGVQLMQAMPVLILIFATLLSQLDLNRGATKFSFSETNVYRNSRVTPKLEVDYWVTDEFERHYEEMAQNPRRDRQSRRELAEFEKSVEQHYLRGLRNECEYQEKVRYKKVMIAMHSSDKEELKKAKSHPRPACKEFEKIKKEHPEFFRQTVYVR